MCLLVLLCTLTLPLLTWQAFYILDELLVGGEIQESSKKNILRAVNAQDVLHEVRLSGWPCAPHVLCVCWLVCVGWCVCMCVCVCMC